MSLMRIHVSHQLTDMFFRVPAAAAAPSLILLQLRVFEALMSLPFDELNSFQPQPPPSLCRGPRDRPPYQRPAVLRRNSGMFFEVLLSG